MMPSSTITRAALAIEFRLKSPSMEDGHIIEVVFFDLYQWQLIAVIGSRHDVGINYVYCAMKKWVKSHVIDHELCPFAKKSDYQITIYPGKVVYESAGVGIQYFTIMNLKFYSHLFNSS